MIIIAKDLHEPSYLKTALREFFQYQALNICLGNCLDYSLSHMSYTQRKTLLYQTMFAKQFK